MNDDTKSKWQKLGKGLAKAGLGTLGTIVGGPAGGVLGSVISDMLGSKDNDDAATAALAKADPATFAKIQEIQASIELARLETQRTEIDATTSKWLSDNASPHWLPNNIRPLTLAVIVLFWIFWNFLTVAIVTYFFSTAGRTDDALTGFFVSVGMQIAGILGTVIVAYFGSRGIEKVSATRHQS
jgi:hypothetical protein